MSAGIVKKTPKNLRVGDFILITRRSDGLLKVAGAKRNSIIARLTAIPKRVPNPSEAGKRGGYALVTSEGTVPFVSGVAAVMLATAEDKKRLERERQARPAAIADSAGVLAGVSGPAVEDASPATPTPAQPADTSPQPAAKQSERPAGVWLAPSRDMREAANDDASPTAAPTPVPSVQTPATAPRPTPADVPPRKVAPAVPAALQRPRPVDDPGVQGGADQHRPAVGPIAASNYAALALACKSEKGRDYWTRLAMAARGEPGW